MPGVFATNTPLLRPDMFPRSAELRKSPEAESPPANMSRQASFPCYSQRKGTTAPLGPGLAPLYTEPAQKKRAKVAGFLSRRRNPAAGWDGEDSEDEEKEGAVPQPLAARKEALQRHASASCINAKQAASAGVGHADANHCPGYAVSAYMASAAASSPEKVTAAASEMMRAAATGLQKIFRGRAERRKSLAATGSPTERPKLGWSGRAKPKVNFDSATRTDSPLKDRGPTVVTSAVGEAKPEATRPAVPRPAGVRPAAASAVPAPSRNAAAVAAQPQGGGPQGAPPEADSALLLPLLWLSRCLGISPPCLPAAGLPAAGSPNRSVNFRASGFTRGAIGMGLEAAVPEVEAASIVAPSPTKAKTSANFASGATCGTMAEGAAGGAAGGDAGGAAGGAADGAQATPASPVARRGSSTPTRERSTRERSCSTSTPSRERSTRTPFPGSQPDPKPVSPGRLSDQTAAAPAAATPAAATAATTAATTAEPSPPNQTPTAPGFHRRESAAKLLQKRPSHIPAPLLPGAVGAPDVKKRAEAEQAVVAEQLQGAARDHLAKKRAARAQAATSQAGSTGGGAEDAGATKADAEPSLTPAAQAIGDGTTVQVQCGAAATEHEAANLSA